MQISEVYVVRFICGLVGCYVIYSLMKMFLPGGKYSKKMESFSYIIYFVLSLLCFYFVRIPIVMLIFNLVFLFIISLNYVADFRQRILTVVYIYCILCFIEMLVAAMTGYIHFPLEAKSMYSSIFGQIANQLLSLITVAIIRVRKKNSDYVSLPWLYWVCLVAFPIFSLYFLVILFHTGKMNRVYTILNLVFLLIINFSVIVLYDLVISSMGTMTKGLLLEQQNRSYEKQLNIMQATIKANVTLQHDLRGHLLALKTYLNNNLTEDASAYVDKMLNVGMKNKNEIYRSGNTIMDSILNYKVQEALDMGIHVNANIRVPEGLGIDSFDIIVVLGNILDNAIDATAKVGDNKKIRICLIYDRRRVMLEVQNTYCGEIQVRQGIPMTTKGDELLHGVGLQNVRTVVEKYRGTVDISYDEKWFKICVMMYI